MIASKYNFNSSFFGRGVIILASYGLLLFFSWMGLKILYQPHFLGKEKGKENPLIAKTLPDLTFAIPMKMKTIFKDPNPFALNQSAVGEKYPLAQLKFVGLIQQGDTVWALIAYPWGEIFHFKKGDILAMQDGKIVAIKNNKLIVAQQGKGKPIFKTLLLNASKAKVGSENGL